MGMLSGVVLGVFVIPVLYIIIPVSAGKKYPEKTYRPKP